MACPTSLNWQLVVHRTSKTSRTSAGVGVMLVDQFTVDHRRQIARRGLVESLPTCGKVEAQHRLMYCKIIQIDDVHIGTLPT